jgi:hypothetical protein
MTTENQHDDQAVNNEHEESDKTADRSEGIIGCGNCLFYERKNDCRTCPDFIDCSQTYLKYYFKLPVFITDNYMSKNKLSHSAFVIFLYICRRANFRNNSKHFGRCWLTLEQISEVTGISVNNMRKYLNELKRLNMIDWSYTRKKDEQGFTTIHEFKVTHLTRLKDMLAEGGKQKKKLIKKEGH